MAPDLGSDPMPMRLARDAFQRLRPLLHKSEDLWDPTAVQEKEEIYIVLLHFLSQRHAKSEKLWVWDMREI